MDGPNVGVLLERAVQRLATAGIESPRRNAEWLFCDVLSTNRAALYANRYEPVDEERAARFERVLRRRLSREPLQYILGFTEFYGLRLIVTPDVLIPRPETEVVVDSALERVAERTAPRMLDAGTGSGCIALAMKTARPDAAVYGCDVSRAALEVAQGNARENGVSVELFLADVLEDRFVSDAPGGLDLIVSNPPYVTGREIASLPPDVRDFEPHLALFAHDDPVVFYRHLARHGRELLQSGGWIVLEIHADFGEEVAGILTGSGYADVEIKQDLAGRDRVVLARR